jgi:hypothetical protein
MSIKFEKTVVREALSNNGVGVSSEATMGERKCCAGY